jgi:GNAT superfamily N-acetyltransferase
MLDMMREYYLYDGHSFDPVRARVALLIFLRDPSLGRAWIVCDGDVPVGYIVLTYGYSLEYLGRDAFIDEFFLRETHRGRGWGRQTLDFVEDQAQAVSVRSIHLEVVRANTTAKEVYRRAGYQDHEHYLMSKWIERGFAKPGTAIH